ncbi:LptF/LptG family permease [Brevundimonas sp.]|uniref:LptF/LptG family permease n=1 Tax=Brevundimonas sp. TaxID=1871086 RepID=UPI0025E4359D|nr:LptF/LptG family permease [Brevundimonas sp.]
MPRAAFARNACMRIIDRYLFRQLAVPVVIAVGALTLVALLGQSLGQLDLIVERGQSAWTVAKVTFLALPQVVTLILPIGVLVGALLALNRLHSEHEIVVCYAGGMSRWRVIDPAIRLSVLVALVALISNLFIQPAGMREMREELHSVRADLAAILVQEGEFVQGAPNLTIYAQRVDQNGIMRNLFIHIERTDGATLYDAATGRITSLDGRPAMILNEGSSSEFSGAGVLNFLSFDEYVFDLTPYAVEPDPLHYKESDRWLTELFFPDPDNEWEQGNREKLYAEGHARLASPLYVIGFMVMALAAVLGGSFSRTGYGRRIAVYSATAIAVRLLGFAVLSAAGSSVWVNVVQYLLPLGLIWFGMRVLFRQRVDRRVAIGAGPERFAGAQA